MSGRKFVNRVQLERNVYMNPCGIVYTSVIKLLSAVFCIMKYTQVFIFIGQAFKTARIAALEQSNKSLLGFNEEFVAIIFK